MVEKTKKTDFEESNIDKTAADVGLSNKFYGYKLRTQGW